MKLIVKQTSRAARGMAAGSYCCRTAELIKKASMLKKIILFSSLLFLIYAALLWMSGKNVRSNDLVAQLNGKSCKYEMWGNVCVRRNLFSSFLRRNDKEQCVIDAAKALALPGPQAQDAVPALIEALNQHRNVDSGDGIIPVRSEIALALGSIKDPVAIKPLIAVLVSDDPVKLSTTASVPPGHKPIRGTSYGAVAEALGMFGPQAKESLPALNNLLAGGQTDSRAYGRGQIEDAIKKINQ